MTARERPTPTLNSKTWLLGKRRRAGLPYDMPGKKGTARLCPGALASAVFGESRQPLQNMFRIQHFRLFIGLQIARAPAEARRGCTLKHRSGNACLCAGCLGVSFFSVPVSRPAIPFSRWARSGMEIDESTRVAQVLGNIACVCNGATQWRRHGAVKGRRGGVGQEQNFDSSR